jgi:hypothetical protein
MAFHVLWVDAHFSATSSEADPQGVPNWAEPDRYQFWGRIETLAEENRIPGNFRIRDTDRPLPAFDADVQKSFMEARRRLETSMKKITAALESKLMTLRKKPS